MPGVVAAFVFGFLAGVVLLRLGRRKTLSRWEQKVLRPLGWAVMSASFTLAAALFAWGLYVGLV
ncbi:MAG: hypothetical protein ABIW16_06665 [Sphingomicrobium sp.]